MRMKTSIWIRTLAMFLCLSLLTESVPMTAMASEPESVQMQAAGEEDVAEEQDSAEEDQSLEDGPSEGDQTVEDDPSGGDRTDEDDPSGGDQTDEDDPSGGDQTDEDDPSGGDQAVEEYPDEEVADSPAMQDGEAETYTLELDNDEGIEESSGPESAKAGDQVTVSVTIKDGFCFYEAIYDVDTGPVHAVEVNENTYSLTFEMPAQNVLLYIKSEPYRKVILVQSEHGTISADRTEGKEGDLVKLTAEPEPGYVLDSWYLTVTDSSGTSEYPDIVNNTFRIKWGDMTVRGNFVPDETDYTITIDQQVDNGTISTANGQDTARWGDNVILIVHPEPGYQMDSLTITDKDGNEVTWNGPGGNNEDEYTFTMPASSVEVSAAFAAVYYGIQVEESEGLLRSYVYVNNEEAGQARLGETIRVKLLPKAGYEISRVTWQAEQGEETEFTVAGDPEGYREGGFTLNTSGDVTIHVYTEKIKFNILSDYDNSKGGIFFLVDNQETDKACNGDRVTVDVQAAEGYVLSRLYFTAFVDDQEESYRAEIEKDNEGKYTFIMEPAVVKVYAEFTMETTLEVRLNWADSGENYTHRDVKVDLQERKDGQDWTTIKEDLVLNERNGWSQSVTIPAEPGAEYRFVEKDGLGETILPGGNLPVDAAFFLNKGNALYEAAYTAAYVIEGGTTAITNTLKRQTYTAAAEWGIGDWGDKPSRIVVELQIYDSPHKKWDVVGQRKELTGANGWTADFTDIPVLKDTYENSVYRIRALNGKNEVIYDGDDEDREDTLAEFNSVRDGSVDIRVTYRNVAYRVSEDDTRTTVTFSDPLVKKTFSVRKEWKEEVEGRTAEISAVQDWKWSFTKLPKYEKGREISYSVTEEKTEVLTGTDGPGTYAFEMVTEAADPESGTTGGRFLKNTHTPETVTIAGKKTWVDNDNAEGKRPGNITIHLLADGTELADKAAEVSADGDGQWSWSFPGLPRNAGGKEINYSIHEDPVPDYTAEVDGYDVTNTYTPGKTQVDVVLKWNDDSNRDGIRPQTVTIQLYEGDTAVIGKTLTLSEADNWQGSFTDLPITREGTRINYNVFPEATDVLSGNPGPGTYGVSMVNASLTPEGETGNYYRITFTHEPETVDLEGTKTWVDDDNYNNTRPESIKIRLLGDGVATGQQETVTADENGEWKWSFTGLPKNKDGKAVIYSVYEDAVKNYTTVIDGMDVTNTLSTEPTFKTYALLLTGLIGVNVYMDLPGKPDKYEDSYMIFTVNGKEERADFNKDFKDEQKLYYGFTGHINSIQMAEPITCTYHYGENGEKTITTVVKASNYIDQCSKIFANNPDVVALLKALGNYGHYVQPYLSGIRHWTIGTDFQEMPGTSEITSDMIQSVSEEVKAYALSTTKGTDSKVALTYSLNLESGTLIYIYVKPEEGTEVSAKLDGKDIAADPLDDGYYLLTIPSIPAHELNKMHTINVTAGEENVDINVCALSYVNTILNPPKGSYSKKAKEAVTSLFNYYRAAVNYIK